MSKLKSKKREIAAALLGVSVAFILWVAIFRRETVVEDSLMYRPFHSIMSFWSNIKKQGVRGNFLGNILIFTPVGILYPIAFGAEGTKKMRRAILFGLCLSLLVELTQFAFSKGYFDFDDVLLNILGTGNGYLIYRVSLYKLK